MKYVLQQDFSEYIHWQFQRAPAKHRECPDIRVKIDKTPLDSDIDFLTCDKQTVENDRFNWHDFRKL